jgi:hypothetical protein
MKPGSLLRAHSFVLLLHLFPTLNSFGGAVGHKTKPLITGEALASASKAIQASLDLLTPFQRMSVLGRYCSHCGEIQPQDYSCKCWDDNAFDP